MRKFVALIVLCASLSGFYSCLDENEPIWYIYDEPALVLERTDNDVFIKTAYGRFLVSGIPGESTDDPVRRGDYLWVNFMVDFGDQPLPHDTLVTNFIFKKINTGELKIIEAGNISNNEYKDTIIAATLYGSSLDSMLFFKFEHRANRDQVFDYEIICPTDSVKEGHEPFPDLYIRAKKVSNSTLGDAVVVSQHFGFNMKAFIDRYNEENELKLYLNYNNGTDGEDDVYKSFRTYPVSWKVK